MRQMMNKKTVALIVFENKNNIRFNLNKLSIRDDWEPSVRTLRFRLDTSVPHFPLNYGGNAYWSGGTQRRFLSCYQSEEMKILNI